MRPSRASSKSSPYPPKAYVLIKVMECVAVQSHHEYGTNPVALERHIVHYYVWSLIASAPRCSQCNDFFASAVTAVVGEHLNDDKVDSVAPIFWVRCACIAS